MKHFFLFKLALITSIVGLTGCAAAPATTTSTLPTTTQPTSIATTTAPRPTSPAQQTGSYGELRIGLLSIGSENFDPILADNTFVGNGLAPMLDHLFHTENSKLNPAIVEKWETSTDGLSWTFNIRKGVKFHNGQDLTADDVKFSIERYMTPQAYFANLRTMIDKVEKVDDYTVRVFTKGRQPYLPFQMAEQSPQQGLVQPKQYIEQKGIEYFKTKPVGSGPFKFVKDVPGDTVTYEAVDKHWKQVPAFKRMAMIQIPEPTTNIAMLKTGEIDFIQLDLESAASLEQQGFKTIVMDLQAPNIYLEGVYESRAAGLPITNIKVRQALSLAINRSEIIKTLFVGKGGPAMPPELSDLSLDIDVAYWKQVSARTYTFDTDQAKKLLAEGGYPNGFSFKLYTFPASGAPYLPKMAEIIQSYWANIGVKAEITPIAMATYTSWRTKPADQLIGQAVTYRTTGGMAQFGPTALDQAYRSTSIFNMVDGAMPDLSNLITSALSETDSAKRMELTAKAIQMAIDTWTYIPICTAPSLGAIGPKVDVDYPPFTTQAGNAAFLFKHK